MSDNENKNMGFSSKSTLVLTALSVFALVVFVVAISKLQTKQVEETVQNSATQENMTAKEIAAAEAAVSLRINEIFHGSSQDYVEIYNPSSLNVDLTGYILTDGTENGRYVFPEGSVLDKGGFTVIHYSSQGEVKQRLTYDDAHTLFLYTADNNLVNYVRIPECDVDESYCRIQDGLDDFTFCDATEGVSDVGANVHEKSYPVISLPSGMYDGEMTVSVSIPEGSTVYYTLDGTEPTEESDVYTEAFTVSDRSGYDNVYSAIEDVAVNTAIVVPHDDVDKATVLKAIAVSGNGTVSDVSMATYFIGYSSKSRYQDIPVISIDTDPEDLFDYRKGIYVKGETYGNALLNVPIATYENTNYASDMQASAHIDYYETDRSISYSGDVILKIYKGDNVDSAQKSFLVSGISSEGSQSTLMEYVSNPDDGRFILSNSSADYSFKFRTSIVNTLVEGTNVDTCQGQPCAVFLDGEYWGLYILENTIDRDYIQNKYELENAMLAGGSFSLYEDDLEYGQLISYLMMNSVSDASVYEQVCQMIDIDSVIDYYAIKAYIGDVSAFSLGQEIVWRSDSTASGYGDGKMRFILGDCGNSIGASATVAWEINPFASNVLNQNMVFASLMCNDQFREKFASRFRELESDYFSTEKVSEVIDAIGGYKDVMAGFYMRYYGMSNGTQFEVPIGVVRNFFDNRQTYMDDYLDEFVEKFDSMHEVIISTSSVQGGNVVVEGYGTTNEDIGYIKVFVIDGGNIVLTPYAETGYSMTGWNTSAGVRIDTDADAGDRTGFVITGNCTIQAVFGQGDQ